MQIEADNLPIRVLLVDDDEDDFLICRDILSEFGGARFQLEWVDRYEAALQAIERKQHDVYLLDYRFGEYTGLDILRDMKTLKTIGVDWSQSWAAAEFWERYDKGEFTK